MTDSDDAPVDAPDDAPVDLRALPPSDTMVYRVVDAEGPITRQALLCETALPESTLQDALDRLEKREYIARARESGDLRRVVVDTVTG